MSGKTINFNDKKVRKSNFYKNKKVFKIDNIDINNVLVSKKEQYGTKNSFKYFIGYNNNEIIRPLRIRLPQMTGYAKKFNENIATRTRKIKQLINFIRKIFRELLFTFSSILNEIKQINMQQFK